MHTALGWACVVLLLLAGSVQAAHFCDLGIAGGPPQVAKGQSPASTGPACVICASAHGAPLATFIPGVTPGLVPPEPVPALISTALAVVRCFALQVRPPPAS